MLHVLELGKFKLLPFFFLQKYIWGLFCMLVEVSTGLDITVFLPLSVTSQVMGDRVGYDG